MITVGTDTYVTVAEADAYFLARFGYDKWAPLDNAVKEQALVSATQQLDTLCTWHGDKVDDDQLLAHPRTFYTDPVPVAVKDAQCEIAYFIVDLDTVSTQADPELESLDAAGKLSWFQGKVRGNQLVNPLVTKLLSPYGLCSGSGSTSVIPMVLT